MTSRPFGSEYFSKGTSNGFAFGAAFFGAAGAEAGPGLATAGAEGAAAGNAAVAGAGGRAGGAALAGAVVGGAAAGAATARAAMQSVAMARGKVRMGAAEYHPPRRSASLLVCGMREEHLDAAVPSSDGARCTLGALWKLSIDADVVPEGQMKRNNASAASAPKAKLRGAKAPLC